MALTSVSFLLFIAVIALSYYLVFTKKSRWVCLLLGSMFFYLMAGAEYLAFLLLTAGSTYLTGLWIDGNLRKQANYLAVNKELLSRDEKKAYKGKVKAKNRLILILCAVLNFGILAVIKVLLVDPFMSLAASTSLDFFVRIGLPLGISFYMFQTVGYTIDVYRGTVKAEKNPLKFLLFASYFPQLVQGPISKYSDLAPQLTAGKDFDGKEFSFGMQRLLWGFFKKLVIADRIAPAILILKGDAGNGFGFFLLMLFYAVQIYGDFTGGIDIVIGLSQMLGIRLTENFVRPFFSKNIAEYWRRWHISLGEWMKSYIFYPISVSQPMLKLSKKARGRLGKFGMRLPVYVASIATWFVTGIWHGITPNFVLWGMMNCFVIVVSEELAPLYEKFHERFGWKNKWWYGCFEIVRMFLLMNFIRVVDLFPNVLEYFRRTFTLLPNFHILWDGTLLSGEITVTDYYILGGGIALLFGVSLFQEKKGSFREFLWNKPVLRYCLMFALLLLVLLLGKYGPGFDAGGFIYGGF